MTTNKPPVKRYEEPVELVATKRGFYNNRLVERGQKFLFTGGVAPKWAIETDKAMPAEPTLKQGDTKPADARAAAQRKLGRATGADME